MKQDVQSRPDREQDVATAESSQSTYSKSDADSTTELSNTGRIDPPPDGGLIAWTQVLLMHLVNFNNFGFMLSFGIFQGYYTDTLGFSRSAVSWVGTIELFFVYFMGTISGRIMDAGHFRSIMLAGLLLQLMGIFMTSLCKEYWQLLLAQGVCQGIGNGLLFCPAIAHIATYFSPTKRSVPIACVASGGGTGGLVFPAIAQTLLYRIGFPWTVRIMGFIALFNAILVMSFVRPRATPRAVGSFVEWQAFREMPFVLFCAGIFSTFWGLYFAYYYIRPFGRDVLHSSPSDSLTLLLITNGAGIPGRVIPGLIADRFIGPVNVLVPVVLFAGILGFCWIEVTSVAGAYVWASFYGFVGGGTQSLFQSASSRFAPTPDKVGVRIGMIFTLVSFACLSGPPLAGHLVDIRGGNYLTAQVFGGTVMVTGSALLLCARLAKTGLKFKIQM